MKGKQKKTNPAQEAFQAACDYVINQWLRDMEVDSMPEGLLYDRSSRDCPRRASMTCWPRI